MKSELTDLGSPLSSLGSPGGKFGSMPSFNSNRTMVAMSLNTTATVSQNNRVVALQDKGGGYGMSFTSAGSTIQRVINHFVTEVKPNGAAAKAGFSKGDRLLQVNGIATYTMNHDMLSAMFKSAQVEKRALRVTLGLKEFAPKALGADAFTVNERVSALHQDDGCWYEASIVDLFTDRSTVSVLYSGFEDDGPHEIETSCITKLDGDASSLPAYWITAYTEGSREKYYYNTMTNETSWERPGLTSMVDELANLATESFADTSLQEQAAYFDTKAFHTAFKLVITREGEEFSIDAGTCEFGGTVPAAGLEFNLHYDASNPFGLAPMQTPAQFGPGSNVCFLLDRGEISVAHKALAAQDAGACCCILINNDGEEAIFNIGSPPGDPSGGQVRIPVSNVSSVDGADLSSAFAEGVTMTAKLVPIIPTNQVDEGDRNTMTTRVMVKKFSRKLAIKLAALNGNYYMSDIQDGGAVKAVGRVAEGAMLIAIDGEPVAGKDRRDVLLMLHRDPVEIEVNNTVLLADQQKLVEVANMVDRVEVPGFPLDFLDRRCEIVGKGEGTIRFIGEHAETGKPRIGVELDAPKGKNNGTVKGKVYFTCEDNHGSLLPPEKVKLIAKKVKGIVKTGPQSGNSLVWAEEGESVKTEKFNYPDQFLELPEVGEPHKAVEDFDTGEEGDLKIKTGDVIMVFNAGDHNAGDPDAEGDPDDALAGEMRDPPYRFGQFPRKVVEKIGGGGGGGGGGMTFNLFGGGGFGGDSGDADDDDDEEESNGITKITLTKTAGVSIGLKFDHYIESKQVGVVVKTVQAGGSAEAAGGFSPGMQIVSLNDDDTNTMSKKDLIRKIRSVPEGGDVRFGLIRPKTIFAMITKVEGRKIGLSFEEDQTIKSVRPDGVAADNWKIQPGLKLTAVNGADTTSLHKSQAVGLIKDAEGTVEFTLMDPEAYSASTPGQAKRSTAADPAPATAAPTASGATLDEAAIVGMGRMALIKYLRDKGVEYKTVARDEEALRKLVRGLQSGGGDEPAAAPAGLPAVAPASAGPSVWIKKLSSNGLGMESGALAEGMRVVALNGRDVNVCTREELLPMIKTGPKTVVFGVVLDGVASNQTITQVEGRKLGISFETRRPPVEELPTSDTEDAEPAAPTGPKFAPKSDVAGFKVADVGKQVIVQTKTGTTTGTLSFVGKHMANGQERCGVELSEALGKMNGSMNDGQHIYFSCADNFGVMVVPSKVSLAAAGGADGVGPAANPPGTTKVTVVRNGKKMGMSMNSANGQLYITRVSDVGAVHDCGKITAGMALMQIGDVDCSAMDKDQAVQVLKTQPDAIVMYVKDDPEGYAAIVDRKAAKAAAKKKLAVSTNPFDANPFADAVPEKSAPTAAKAAKAKAAAPKAAKAGPGTVRIVKTPGMKLGISMTPGPGVEITKITPNGLAAFHPECVVGAKILAVNGKDVTRAMKADIVELVKANPKHVDFAFSVVGSAAPKKSKAAVVSLTKSPGMKLGISMDERSRVVGTGQVSGGVWVSKVTPGGIAAGNPAVKVGTQITSVNGVDTTASSKKDVIALIKMDPNGVDFTFGPTTAGTKKAVQPKRMVVESAYGTVAEGKPVGDRAGVCVYTSVRGKCNKKAVVGDLCQGHSCPVCGSQKGSREDLCKTCATGDVPDAAMN